MQTFLGNIVTEYRRFFPQVAYVLLAIATVVQSDVQKHTSLLAGLSIWAIVVAAIQAAAVVLPSNVVVKVSMSLLAAIGQVVASALTDNTITVGEWMLIAVGFLTWAASASHINIPTGAYLVAKVPYGASIQVGTSRN